MHCVPGGSTCIPIIVHFFTYWFSATKGVVERVDTSRKELVVVTSSMYMKLLVPFTDNDIFLYGQLEIVIEGGT